MRPGGLLVGGGADGPALACAVVETSLANYSKEAMVIIEKIKITGTASAREQADLDYRIELTMDPSLRDLFVAFALAGLISQSDRSMPTRVFAKEAYSCADSMLAQREE